LGDKWRGEQDCWLGALHGSREKKKPRKKEKQRGNVTRERRDHPKREKCTWTDKIPKARKSWEVAMAI